MSTKFEVDTELDFNLSKDVENCYSKVSKCEEKDDICIKDYTEYLIKKSNSI